MWKKNSGMGGPEKGEKHPEKTQANLNGGKEGFPDARKKNAEKRKKTGWEKKKPYEWGGEINPF